ncbi:gephyrin-like molybdotransferase Glp [uncultured Devosia sp.]|uniref:molybdopterin molybdotransferase MoeA n=1 Tax=uncultured Devosia sp. TaxID=211434 RepID=UPI0035CA4642
MSLLPVEHAITKILQRVPPMQTERVALPQAAGRVLAEAMVASHDQPPFNASAMDGYAVRARDAAPGASLRIIGMSQAGAGFAGVMGAGECVRIFTGAPVPQGADAVIMQELASVNGQHVRFAEQPQPGRSIRPMGSDFAVGQTLVEPGTRLNGLHLAVAAAANVPTLMVGRQPVIALLATGDELVPPGSRLGADQIVASNSYGLGPLLAPYGRIVDHGIAGDDRAGLTARLRDMFADEPDIVVTTGGASVGDHDIVQDVLVALGVTLDFWRINMRPGKPLMFGTRGKTLVFGLPGNPVSALVTAVVFIKPALRLWLGAGAAPGRYWRLPLAAPTPPNSVRRHFMRAQLVHEETGTALRPIAEVDSGHTSSLAQADMLIVQPEHDPGQATGTMVDAISIGQF